MNKQKNVIYLPKFGILYVNRIQNLYDGDNRYMVEGGFKKKEFINTINNEYRVRSKRVAGINNSYLDFITRLIDIQYDDGCYNIYYESEFLEDMFMVRMYEYLNLGTSVSDLIELLTNVMLTHSTDRLRYEVDFSVIFKDSNHSKWMDAWEILQSLTDNLKNQENINWFVKLFNVKFNTLNLDNNFFDHYFDDTILAYLSIHHSGVLEEIKDYYRMVKDKNLQRMYRYFAVTCRGYYQTIFNKSHWYRTKMIDSYNLLFDKDVYSKVPRRLKDMTETVCRDVFMVMNKSLGIDIDYNITSVLNDNILFCRQPINSLRAV